MGDALAQLQPRSLWSLFDKITEIPRPSRHEERVAKWVCSVADEHGFKVHRDNVGNLVVRVPATPGHEDAPAVILQSHLDMVCEKNKDTLHDFMVDPIRTRIDGEYVTASGTTLGADNGIGVAAALAAAIDDSIRHGPLELLFTVDEETGLSGAAGLDGSMLTGRILLNLDSEEDGVIFVGCAGGADNHLHMETPSIAPTAGGRAFKVEVAGLRGGHSGLNIHENRGNAIKILTQLLASAIDSGIGLELASLTGGSMRNAIPREAEALMFLSDGDADRFRGGLGRMLKGFRRGLSRSDPGLEIRFEPSQHEGECLERVGRNNLLRLLLVLPDGCLGISPDMPGLVETSNCVSVIERESDGFRIIASSRSSVDPRMDALLGSIRAAAGLAGAEVTVQGRYPGWTPNMDSDALRVVGAVYSEVWGTEPEITAVHAGLECGLLGEKISGLDMVSFGPQIEEAHSPAERVHIESVGRFWTALACVLEEFATVGSATPASPGGVAR